MKRKLIFLLATILLISPLKLKAEDKKSPSIVESWKKVVSIKWNDLGKDDLINLGLSTGILLSIGGLIAYGWKKQSINNDTSSDKFSPTQTNIYSKNSTTGWSKVDPNQKEYNDIRWGCAKIATKFASHQRSSAYQLMLFEYLKNIGSPVSLQVLKEKIDAKEIDSSFLRLI